MTHATNHPVHLDAPLSPAAKKAAQKRHADLVHQTQRWVAQSFYGTLLKQMREDPFRSDMFDGGNGGKAFESMFDQEISQRMTRGAAPGLVNSIVQKIEGKKASDSYLMQSNPAAHDAALRARMYEPITG